MPKLIGLLCALVALTAAILAKAEPVSAIIRALFAFLAGSFLTQVWYVFFAARVAPKRAAEKESDEEAA